MSKDKHIEIKDSKGNTIAHRVEHPDGSSDTYKHDSSIMNRLTNSLPVPTGIPSSAGENQSQQRRWIGLGEREKVAEWSRSHRRITGDSLRGPWTTSTSTKPRILNAFREKDIRAGWSLGANILLGISPAERRDGAIESLIEKGVLERKGDRLAVTDHGESVMYP
jgi:hypothetical protein